MAAQFLLYKFDHSPLRILYYFPCALDGILSYRRLLLVIRSFNN